METEALHGDIMSDGFQFRDSHAGAPVFFRPERDVSAPWIPFASALFVFDAGVEPRPECLKDLVRRGAGLFHPKVTRDGSS